MSKSEALTLKSTFGGEDVPPFSKAAWPYYWITRVSALYAFEMEKRLKPMGLDVSRWRVLSSLREHGNLGVAEIADYSILKLNTTTKIVQRMVNEGLVTTRSSAVDARVTEVSLTEKGFAAAVEASHLANTVFERTFYDIKDREIDQMNGLLKRIFERFI